MNINKKKEDFYKMNIDKKNDKNIGRNKVSFNDDDSSKFSSICLNEDNIIKKKDYDPVYFYGIILSYLNNNVHENFKKNLKNFTCIYFKFFESNKSRFKIL